MDELTDRRRLILLVVDAFTRARGYSPSVGEITDAVGLASKAPVHRHLRILCDGGWLSQQPHRDRTLHLGPRAAVSLNGLVAEVVRIERCEVCGTDMPADHTHLNETAAAAEAPAVAAEETPTPSEGTES